MPPFSILTRKWGLSPFGTAKWGQTPFFPLAVTVLLHLLLAGLFLLRQPPSAPHATADWIELVRVKPAPAASAPVRPPDPRQRRQPARVRPPVSAPAMPAAAPAGAPERVTEAVFPDLVPATPDLLERARAAAGSADKELRKQFPERALLRTTPRTERQKLADGIARSVAPPKFYEPARITSIQDQGVGWNRRVEKVQTAFGTYCITQESNHGGDGRDVFRDAQQLKLRSCPREQ